MGVPEPAGDTPAADHLWQDEVASQLYAPLDATALLSSAPRRSWLPGEAAAAVPVVPVVSTAPAAAATAGTGERGACGGGSACCAATSLRQSGTLPLPLASGAALSLATVLRPAPHMPPAGTPWSVRQRALRSVRGSDGPRTPALPVPPAALRCAPPGVMYSQFAHDSATLIQRKWRAWLRARALRLAPALAAARAERAEALRWRGVRPFWEHTLHVLASVHRLQRAFRDTLRRRAQRRRRHWAAARIQALGRGWLDRRTLALRVEMRWRRVVVHVQAFVRGRLTRLRYLRWRAQRRVWFRHFWPASVLAKGYGHKWLRAFRCAPARSRHRPPLCSHCVGRWSRAQRAVGVRAAGAAALPRPRAHPVDVCHQDPGGMARLRHPRHRA